MTEWFGILQQRLFESVVQPIAFASGMGNLLDLAYDGTGWVLVGVLQFAVMLAVFYPLEMAFPVFKVTDWRAVRVDILYTAIHRLGLFKLLMFFSIDPLVDHLVGEFRVMGFPTFHLELWWPGASNQPVLAFMVYLVVFDFIQYLIHRGQHQFEWWWALHSLHHSQRQMTMWSDNRNHLLDDVLRDLIFVGVAVLVGVPPGQFVALVAFAQLSESFQHANLRIWFGHVGERIWVSPRFHRMHHSIGIGHESAGVHTLGGCNFGVLLPWWDMALGTANFELRFDDTGVRDQVEDGRDYGAGFWQQQWRGLLRMIGKA